jgi:hypothetical protein
LFDCFDLHTEPLHAKPVAIINHHCDTFHINSYFDLNNYLRLIQQLSCPPCFTATNSLPDPISHHYNGFAFAAKPQNTIRQEQTPPSSLASFDG